MFLSRVHRLELYDDAHETLLFVGGWAAIPVLARHGRVLADGDGRLRQHRPEARACQGSLLGSLLRFCSRHGPRTREEEGAGRQETKKKTLLQVARGTHKHQRTGFLMAMLLLIAVPMRSALTPQLGAQLDPGARNMTDM